MIPLTEGWTVVATGFWNQRIFSPAWLQERGIVQAGQQIGLEVAVNFAAPPRLSFDGITLRVDSTRLVVGTDAITDARLTRMENIVVSVLDTLPHTPIAAVGVNFQWIEDAPSAELLRCFQASDSDELAAANLEIRSTVLKRTLDDDGGRTLNLTLTLQENGHVLFDFNFHFATANAVDGRNAISNRVLQLRDRALAILQAAYELEPVEQ